VFLGVRVQRALHLGKTVKRSKKHRIDTADVLAETTYLQGRHVRLDFGPLADDEEVCLCVCVCLCVSLYVCACD